MKNLEAILRANDLAMLQIYYEEGILRIALVDFDTEGTTSKSDMSSAWTRTRTMTRSKTCWLFSKSRPR